MLAEAAHITCGRVERGTDVVAAFRADGKRKDCSRPHAAQPLELRSRFGIGMTKYCPGLPPPFKASRRRDDAFGSGLRWDDEFSAELALLLTLPATL
jgi:hypothetical protein